MKKLSQILEESISQEAIVKNATIPAIKNMATNSKYKIARFVVRHDGKWVAGSANHHVHASIEPNESDIKCRGYVKQIKGKHVFHIEDENYEDYEGPEVRRLKTYKMEFSKN